MKLCTLCKVIEIESGSWCSKCKSEYFKKYRKDNQAHLKKLNQSWRQNNKEHYKEYKYESFATLKGRIQNLIKSARKRAKNKNIEFSIDIPWLTEKFSQQNNKCALTNIDFIIPTERGVVNPFVPSLDRIDPNKGYTKDNVRIVCYAVNCCLHNYGEEIFNYVSKMYFNLSCKQPVFTENYPVTTSKQKKDKKYSETLNGVVCAIFSGAKKRNKNITISKQDIEHLFKQQNNKCSLTQIEFDLKKYQKGKDNPFRPSLDRIDSSLGYIPGNVRLVCIAVNFALNEFGEEIFKLICQKYLTNSINL